MRTAPGLSEMSVAECLACLGSVTTGRLAVTHRALPCVVPVRMQVVDDEIVVESYLGGLVPLVPGVVALEAGTFGDGALPEWTVGVRGFLTRPEDQAVPTAKGRMSAAPEMFRLSVEYVTGWKYAHRSPASGRDPLGQRVQTTSTSVSRPKANTASPASAG